jgi:hypothetical protein
MRLKSVNGVPLALQIGPSYNQWSYDTNPPEKRLHGWQGVKWNFPGYSVHFPRAWESHVSRCRWRMAGEVNIAGSQCGFGGIGADFWPALKDSRGRLRGSIASRYPKSSWRNLDIRASVLWAAPDGAALTVRYQVMREGIQECEARIRIDEALVEGRLKGAAAKRAQNLLDERVIALTKGMGKGWAYGGHWSTQKSEFPEFINGGWQERSGELYEEAGKTK